MAKKEAKNERTLINLKTFFRQNKRLWIAKDADTNEVIIGMTDGKNTITFKLEDHEIIFMGIIFESLTQEIEKEIFGKVITKSE